MKKKKNSFCHPRYCGEIKETFRANLLETQYRTKWQIKDIFLVPNFG